MLTAGTREEMKSGGSLIAVDNIPDCYRSRRVQEYTRGGTGQANKSHKDAECRIVSSLLYNSAGVSQSRRTIEHDVDKAFS